MKPDVTINGVSMLSLGWLRESVNFPTPQSQSETIVVPGRSSPIRFTEALGRVSYQPRSFEITLAMLGSRARFNSMVSAAVNRFAGNLARVVCSEEPGLYAVGTLEAAPSYDPLTGKGQLVFSCADGDAYIYHTAETSLSWTVGGDTFQKSVSAGMWEFPELELQAGTNTVTVSGSGITTFRYREGRL